MIRSKYAINLSLDDLYQIREAFKLHPPPKDGAMSNLPGKINKAIVILEGLKKRGDKRDDKRLQGTETAVPTKNGAYWEQTNMMCCR